MYKYYVSFIDHFSRFTWLFPLRHKSEVSQVFLDFKVFVEKQFGLSILAIYSDIGGEYQSLGKLLSKHGIKHLKTPPHILEHNGLAERKHRHLVETGKTMLHQASMPSSYWPHALEIASYLINRMPTSVLQNKSPYEVLFRTKPNYIKLQVFGCLTYPWLQPYSTKKLQPKSRPVFS